MSIGVGSAGLFTGAGGSGGSGAPLAGSYVVIAADGTLTNERVLTGTGNQIIITDGGAGGNIVVSLPQDVHPAAQPTFASLILEDGLIQSNMAETNILGPDANATLVLLTDGAVVGPTGLSIGGPAPTRATTNPTAALTILDGVAPSGAQTGAVQYYSVSGVPYVKNAAGTERNLMTGGGDLVAANNLSDVASAATARTNLGVGTRDKTITIESPTSTEDLSFFFTTVAITITRMVAVLNGSATPSVTWTIRHDTDRNATGNQVVTGGTTTTSTTTGSVVTSFNDATIPANSFVWLETTAKSGTVTVLSTAVFYTTD